MATKEEVLATLNEDQRKAVIDYQGNMCIEAGPGSGKTATIVARCQYMILDGVKPSSILVFTFTKKAANELRDRIQRAVGEHAAKEMTISTYHSFCGKLLRRFAEHVGRNRNFSIYDEDDKKSVLAPICKKHSDFKYVEAKDYISNFKMKNITASKAVTMEFDNSFAKVAAKIYKEYDDVMAKCNAFDFDDLVFRAYLLLQNFPEARDFVHNKFKYILSDENQDANHQNLDFILLLRGDNGNLCVVGDSDQSIYGFRGSDIANVLRVTSGSEFKHATLGRNYRSTKTIVNASSCVINKNIVRTQKKLTTENEDGEAIIVSRFRTTPEETRKIAFQIKELHEVNEIPYDHMAILVRLQWHTRELERNLLDLGIPYQLKGLLPFYARKEIKDMTSYLRILSNPNDMDAYARAITIPKRNIGAASIEKILQKARQTQESCDIIELYRDLRFAPRIYNACKGFESLITNLRSSEFEDVGELLQNIVERIDYFNYLENECKDSSEYNERVANVEELIRFCSHYVNISDFLENFVIDPIDMANEKETKPGVNIMTMHGSKGLEFDVVFMTSMNDNVCPFIKSQTSPEEIEEERRLFYVAMTRAKKKLFISYALQYGTRNSMAQGAFKSRFITDIPKQYVKYYAS
ncbi:MAG: ATP-dependent helicase [Clostridiales bacterium]|nr:ATP-dependent helicase [Clostridiales bacterium]